MRKVALYKWFLLLCVLTVSLTAFSFLAYRKSRQVCGFNEKCSEIPQPQAEKDLLIDVLSRQFTSFVVIP